MRNLGILIIEDDIIWQVKTVQFLEEAGYTNISTCSTFEDVITSIELQKPDLIISDIMLGNNNIFEALINTSIQIPILLMTASDDESFFSQALHFSNKQYLVKPFHKYSLLSSVESLINNSASLGTEALMEGCIEVKGIGNEKLNLKESQILYIKSEQNYCIIRTAKSQYAIKSSLDKLLKIFRFSFVRTHKSYLINKKHITKIAFSKNQIVCHEFIIPIGRQYKKILLQELKLSDDL